MAKQTFIICVEDQNGFIVDFERWACKKVETCIAKMIELYKTYSILYAPKLDGAARVTAYPTPNGYDREAPVWSVTADEFRALIEKEDPICVKS